MNKIKNLIRQDLLNYKPYGVSKEEVRENKICLHLNEMPYEDNLFLNRYPDSQPSDLLKLFSKLYQVNLDQLAMLRGSDEAIDLLIRLFCAAQKDSILVCPPTFGMYALYAKLQDAKALEVPLLTEKGLALNLSEIKKVWHPQVKLIFICSPNNPTGHVIAEKDILDLCEHFDGKSMVVVDEAYIEFTKLESMARFLNRYSNLIVLRTLSKAYCLAGARCGFVLANTEVIEWINKIMAPFPLSFGTIQTIRELFLLERQIKIEEQVNQIKIEREKLSLALSSLSIVKKVFIGEGNFLLVEMKDTQKVMEVCAKNNIVLRDLSHKPFLKNCIRITIGLPEENDQLLNILSRL